jgi:hypothetical protein
VTPSVFVAQSPAGSGDGKSCATAKGAAFFNTASNWGAGKPIGPGAVVGVCGTISSTLAAEGSGASGKPVTVYFTSGARISQPACSPCLDLDDRSYITVDGGSNGIIESTDNGTHLGLHVPSNGIHADSCDHCEIEHLTIQNIYVHDGAGDNTEIDQTQVRSIWANGSNLSIHDNVLHDAGWSVFVAMDNGDHDIHVFRNDIYNVDHGFIASSGTAGGAFGPIWFNNNHVHDFQNWDTASNAYHHDGIHCYTVAGGQPMHITDFYIYDNRFDGSIGGNATSWIFMEDSSGPTATPCADGTSRIWLFNNVGRLDRGLGNGVFGMFSGRTFAYNNTLIGSAHESPNTNLATGGAFTGPGALKNNVMTTSNTWIGAGPDDYPGSEVDNNVYADGNPNGNGWVCNGFLGRLSQWQRCIGGDAHAVVTANAKLNADGSPQPGSPVLGAGTSLASLCTGNLTPLCYDIGGRLRPQRMAPDAGAYQAETAAITARTIGRVGLGDSQERIEQAYGRGRTSTARRPLFGVFDLRGLATSTYRIHRGLLDVSYAGGKVVAISTTSRYYTTIGGLGPGAQADPSKLMGSGWRACGRALVRRRSGVATAVALSRGLVTAVTVTAASKLRCS